MGQSDPLPESPEARGRARRRRLLVVMHVDWRWIKQRPQLVAEALDDAGFDVLVAYIPSWRRSRLVSNPSRLRRFALPVLPLRRWVPIGRLSAACSRAFLAIVARAWPPDALLLTAPELVDYLPRLLRDTPLIYDCMDLASGFTSSASEMERITHLEKRLVGRAQILVASSGRLASHLASLASAGSRPLLVRNGIDSSDLSAGPLPELPRVNGRTRAGYAGTVASWLDADAIVAALDALPGLEVHLWGPVVIALPRHPRLLCHGPIPRYRLREAVASMDCFLMPFKMDDLTRAVDPVKLYEYLAWGRPAIAVSYAELDQFGPLVQRYETIAELIHLLGEVGRGELSCPDRSSVEAFLVQATWRARVQPLADRLARYLTS